MLGLASAKWASSALLERRHGDLDLVLLDRPHYRTGNLLGRAGAEAGGGFGAGVGVHPRFADDPGETIETPTPRGSRSARSPSAKPRRPNLVAL